MESFEFIRPDQPSKCTWRADADPATSPHTKTPLVDRPKIMPNVLHAIGQTPLVRLNTIPKEKGLKCELLAKCEFFNPGGSVKDRIGYRMVEDAEKKGILKPGSVVVEPTSGNTGIGLAMACAVKGYRCIIVMPEKMSNEKVDALRSLGAEIIRTPTAAAFDAPEGLMVVAQKMAKEIPNGVLLDQYRNPGNPLAHYDTTAEEIIQQCDGKLDMLILTAGTGGTVTGIGRRIKEKCPNCVVVAVDPEGSILAQPESLNKTDVTFYEVEGIGYDFIPTVLDRSVADKWVKSNDAESLPLARELIKKEGLLCGGSSGAALYGALKAAKDLKAGQRAVVILPDGIRNYMTKFVSDGWMEARGFLDSKRDDLWWWDLDVSNITVKAPTTIPPTTTCKAAIELMEKEKISELAVVDANGKINGMLMLSNIMAKLIAAKVKPEDTADKVLYNQYRKVRLDAKLGKLACMLEKEPYVVVMKNISDSKDDIIGLVRSMDVMSFATKK